MQTTILYPNAPIFPGTLNKQSARPNVTSQSKANSSRPNNIKSTPQAKRTSSPATAASSLFPRSEANPSAPMNFIRKIQAESGSGSPPPPISAPTTLPSLNLENGDMESRESTPASPPYPKPGNGLMAKLGPDDEDTEWLVDDFDSDAFSHTFYAQNEAAQVEGNVDVNGVHGHEL